MKKGQAVNLTREQRVEIVRLLRDARANVLRDSEAFHDAALVLEHIGQIIGEKLGNGLDSYQNELLNLAAESFTDQPDHSFMLFETVRLARNDVVHGGAYVRHLTDRLVELLNVLEDAAMSKLLNVKDIMVRDVVRAEEWQSIASVRRAMLSNAFSFVPVKLETCCWQLIPVFAIVRFLGRATKKDEVMKRMAMSVAQAIDEDKDLALPCDFCKPETLVTDIVDTIEEKPVLVTTNANSAERLHGIVTSFDLLSYTSAVHYISGQKPIPSNGIENSGGE